MWREPWRSKLARRAISVPIMFLLAALYLALLPPLLLYSVIRDGLARRPLLLCRFHLTMVGTFLWHLVGITGLFAFWVGALPFLHRDVPRWRRWNLALEGWWGSHIIGIPELFYRMRMEIRGDREALHSGPVLVFGRHTSIIDTMLPLRLLEYRNGMSARIVKKRELLWDPCVDSISQRLPRAFVRRGSANPEAEIDLVRRLGLNLASNEGVWIFPEGTRFSVKKRQQIIDRLRSKGQDEAAARAEELTHTLPPKPGGALALLDACPGVDVVFCAHTGMEGANRLENFTDGSLYRRRILVEMWRVKAADIPASPEARALWLHAWWKTLDRWVAENQDRDLTELLAREGAA